MKKRLGRLLWTLLALISSNFSVLAQPSEKEKPRLIDFGSSLRPDFVKKNREDQKTEKRNGGAGEEDVIRINTELVVSDVMVTDKQGRLIRNLTKDDFIVTEDNLPQQVETFSIGDGGTIPRSIVLIIDYSGSQLPYIKTSVAAAKTLIDKLKPQDRVAIVTDDVELLADFTRDRRLLKEKLDSLETNALSGRLGRSHQYSALLATLNELFDEEDVRPIVIFQTDGDEFGFLKGNFTPLDKEVAAMFPYEQTERNFSYKDVVMAAEKARATVYTVIPGARFMGLSDRELVEQGKITYENRIRMSAEILNRPALPPRSKENIERWSVFYAKMILRQHVPIASLAKSTGGWADYLEKPEQADDVYSRILIDIDNRYLLGYYPTNQTRDGKRRTVKVAVRGHPEYKVWGRKAYFAPEPK